MRRLAASALLVSLVALGLAIKTALPTSHGDHPASAANLGSPLGSTLANPSSEDVGEKLEDLCSAIERAYVSAEAGSTIEGVLDEIKQGC